MQNNIIIRVENFFKIMWIVILSIFAPIGVSIYVLSFFFVVNFFLGFQTDRLVYKNDFSLEKVKKGVMLFILYFALLFIINVSLSLYGEDDLAVTVPKFFTWIACYWYLVNIIRNAKLIFPSSEGLKFFYNLLTIQILDLIFAKFGLKNNSTDGEKKKNKE